MNSTPPPIRPLASLDELHTAATEAFCKLAEHCVAEKGIFRVALSGGSTPRGLYQRLAGRTLPWQEIHWFWGDERNVPHAHAESNYRMVREALLDHVPAPEKNIHPVPIDVNDAASAARVYEQSLRDHFAGQAFPKWDLVLLGLGDDAHTASLFPDTRALEENQRWFVENWVEKFGAYRYTLTAPAIDSGSEIWFLVSGSGKRAAMGQVIGGEKRPRLYPAQLVRPTRWFVTTDAHES